MNSLEFRKANKKDLDIILNIYNFYITNTTVTFDHRSISKKEFLQRIFIGNDKYPTYLIINSNDIAGFCFLTQYRKKEAYNRTVEIGLYLKPELTGKGIGQKAMVFLENIATNQKIRVIIASISGENVVSIKLFEKTGYEKCAHYKEIGEKFGRFVDIIEYQKILPV